MFLKTYFHFSRVECSQNEFVLVLCLEEEQVCDTSKFDVQI